MNHNHVKTAPDETTPDKTPPRMSEHDFALWGLSEIAYIKPIEVAGDQLFGIFAANGEQIGVMPNADIAWVAVRQHDMQPFRVH